MGTFKAEKARKGIPSQKNGRSTWPVTWWGSDMVIREESRERCGEGDGAREWEGGREEGVG